MEIIYKCIKRQIDNVILKSKSASIDCIMLVPDEYDSFLRSFTEREKSLLTQEGYRRVKYKSILIISK